MQTNWDLVKANLLSVIEEDVKYLGEAMALEEAITELIEKRRRGNND